MTFVLVIIILALIFDYINGFHDAANSIATVVSTKVLTPFQAVLWAAFFNVVAFFIFKDHAVANTIGKTVFKEYITLPVIFSGLIAAIFWNLLTWWFGIPSSSSHTLIGGFAGAALTAAWMKDSSLDIEQIVDSAKIWKTIAFILLAPLIGMFISMFFTLVMIHRNTWIKCGILALMSIGVWIMFQNFQETKIQDNMGKFYRLDKNTKIVDDETIKLTKEKNPEKQAEIKKKIEEAQIKVETANKALDDSKPFIHQYESKGADWVATQLVNNVDMKATEISRIVDKLNAYFKTDQLKVLAGKNQLSKTDYEFAKSSVDSLKPIAKNFHSLGFDAMVNAMIAKSSITKPSEQLSFKLKLASVKETDFNKNPEMKLHLTTKEDIVKVLEDSDNKTIRYFMIGGLIIFIFTFIYSEKMREPTARSQASVFKRLQLLSSAGFSIGHGGNDAQKVMGIIAAAMVANGNFNDLGEAMNDTIGGVQWIPVACYAAIGLGTLSGGWKIVKTMGTKITKVTPLEGVCAETAGATTLFLTEQMGIPVSTTHTITGAIIGVGATKRLSAVRWGVTINLLWAWILTIPVSAIVAALTYWVVSGLL
jgi:PiT family inorganic phosphate transporter